MTDKTEVFSQIRAGALQIGWDRSDTNIRLS